MKRLAVAALLFLCLTGCVGRTESVTKDFFAMDTFMSITVLGDEAEALAQICEEQINSLENMLSRTREESAVWKLNGADGEPVSLPEAAELLARAIRFGEETGGLYDPTIAALTDLWGIGTENARVPTQDEIDAVLARTGGKLVQVSGDVFALQDGAQLDLGGIAKGYAADRCAALLREKGASGLLRLGGNIYAVGSNQGRDWVIGIADPDQSSEAVATIAVQDLSVVTSGDYERYVEQDGKRYHHIFDPRTGRPAESGLRSVTVADADSTKADAMTTALFVMGLEDGMAFCEQNDIAAVFITADRRVVTTSAVHEIGTFTFDGEEKGYSYAQ